MGLYNTSLKCYLLKTLFLSFFGSANKWLRPSAENNSTAIGCNKYRLLCTSLKFGKILYKLRSINKNHIIIMSINLW